MALRLIASDLDGTLFGANKVPAPRTVRAINSAVDAGITFAAVTGRSYFGGANRVVSTGASVHWFIGSNGGHRLNMTTKALEERLIFSAKELASIVTTIPEHLPGIGFGLEHGDGFTYDQAFYAALPEAFDGGKRADSAIWAPDDVGKIFATHPTMTNQDIVATATPLVPPGTHVSTSGGAFVEFTPAGADKGLALGRLCEQLRIRSDEVIAFGDNNNDLSMLQWAGHGVAMANATPDALAIADQVTTTNVDFGVARVIESLL